MYTVTTEMAPDLRTIAQAETAPPSSARWTLATRVAFRFCALYFGAYVLATQMFGGLVILPKVDVPSLGEVPPWRSLVTWMATRVLGYSAPLTIQSGSGDKPFDLALIICLALLAAIGTIVWSILARRRTSHPGVHKWFRVQSKFRWIQDLPFNR